MYVLIFLGEDGFFTRLKLSLDFSDSANQILSSLAQFDGPWKYKLAPKLTNLSLPWSMYVLYSGKTIQIINNESFDPASLICSNKLNVGLSKMKSLSLFYVPKYILKNALVVYLLITVYVK